MPFKPGDYPSASPYLVVEGAQATIDFLVEVFGAVRLRVVRNDTGGVAHGEVRLDDSVLMLSDAV
ncbi:MAG TPA: VOC family protein, partial [Luteimonas sp.]|nr:VOC family protein [Luteimonas sp.]